MIWVAKLRGALCETNRMRQTEGIPQIDLDWLQNMNRMRILRKLMKHGLQIVVQIFISYCRRAQETGQGSAVLPTDASTARPAREKRAYKSILSFASDMMATHDRCDPQINLLLFTGRLDGNRRRLSHVALAA